MQENVTIRILHNQNFVKNVNRLVNEKRTIVPYISCPLGSYILFNFYNFLKI